MKYVIYYTVGSSGKVSRDYQDYPLGTNVQQTWTLQPGNYGKRKYLQHEPHDDYVAAFAPMVGQDEYLQRDWLEERVIWLDEQAAQQAARQQAGITPLPAPSNPTHPGNKPGDIVRDQHGRSGRVPEVPLEVFRAKPINTDAAMDAVRAAGKGGGAHIKGN